jgi:hypothetical protein
VKLYWAQSISALGKFALVRLQVAAKPDVQRLVCDPLAVQAQLFTKRMLCRNILPSVDGIFIPCPAIQLRQARHSIP